MDDNIHLRRARKGQTIQYTTPEGAVRELVADDEGVITPDTVEDSSALDGFDLSVARKAERERMEIRPEQTEQPDEGAPTPQTAGEEGSE